ncbi:uncharacterized protein MAM_06275 [Metarhizium album ARSEF 1941]|uniref:Uncharacterized protein n=1 Tax=Metarhizium album (strain ARSEF 1941) TaxID=1081103 RepID=A0A0B2WPH1_METAS|nr:uncharacterized protein MAM_06275 [Metarhizium album ARSEF 1941]KHN95913.1 hypothetical protein MAM_06275 [Metarhizium album ARSEF 1941]
MSSEEKSTGRKKKRRDDNEDKWTPSKTRNGHASPAGLYGSRTSDRLKVGSPAVHTAKQNVRTVDKRVGHIPGHRADHGGDRTC